MSDNNVAACASVGADKMTTGTGASPRGPELADAVCEVLEEARRLLGASANDTTAALKSHLRQDLTLAVAGRTNAGKSTLVNALIGERVAPTAKTECTRVVTWFRFGPHQPKVLCTNGEEIPLWLTNEGRLPDDLPVPAEHVQRIEVWLDYEPLRNLTVIDTPGLSGDEGLADQTEQLLGSGRADVLLFVLSANIRADEHRILAEYRRRSREVYDFPCNAHGVISRADQFTGPDGPWAKTQAVAAQHALTLAGELAGVLPVMGKLAETTESGAFNEDHARWLRTVADLRPDERQRALGYAQAFKRADVLSAGQRQALLDRLDLFGIGLLTAQAYAHSSAVEMYDALRAASGIAALQNRINVMFARPAAVHKAARALADLEAFVCSATQPGHTRDVLLDRIQVIRDSPAMHPLAELRALAALYSGRSRFGDAVTNGRALTLFEETDPARRLSCEVAEIPGAAALATRYWKSLANNVSDPLTRWVAETAATSAHLMRSSGRSRT